MKKCRRGRGGCVCILIMKREYGMEKHLKREKEHTTEYVLKKAVCFRAGEFSKEEKYIVPEEKYDLYLNGEMIHTFFCSPWYLEDLAYGFLYLEGYILKAEQIKEICVKQQEHRIEVVADKECEMQKQDAKETGKKAEERKISPEEIMSLAAALDERSHRFRLTGGVHSAALAKDGEILLMREDVGRHNAVEKLLGACIREQLDTADKTIVFSGRVAAEILEKAVAIGAPTLIAVSAPTSRAVELAEEKGILLVGFARGESFNVYTFPERVTIFPH